MSIASSMPGSQQRPIDWDGWRQPLMGATLILGLFVGLFWGFLRSQFMRAITEQSDWGHLLVVPLIAGYFVYLNRGQLLGVPFRTTWSGVIPIIVGMGIYMTSVMGPPSFNHLNIQGMGVWLTMFGLTLLFFGWRAMKWLWFPLAYLLFFGQYISAELLNRVTFQMQDITARGAHLLLALFLQVDRSGNTISIFHNGESKALNIAQACSGMRMLVAFLALGVAMGYTGFKPLAVLGGAQAWAEAKFARIAGRRGPAGTMLTPLWFLQGAAVAVLVLAVRNWQRVVLVMLAVPTAIFVNVLRVCSLGLLTLANSDFAAGDFHSFVGLVWLVPAFVIYLGLMWVIRHVMVEVEPAAKRTAVTR